MTILPSFDMVEPMRLVSFRHAGAAKFGLVVDGGIVDLSARLSSRWPSLRAAIAAKALGELAVAAKGAGADLKFEDVELDPVIPNPEKILCIGLNYASHVGEVGRQLRAAAGVDRFRLRGRAGDRDRRALPARAAGQRARGRGGLHRLPRHQRP